MSSNIVNNSPYLRNQREFPEELTQLTVEVNKAYVDTANIVNARTIGLFPVNVAAVNGESWYINQNKRQQGLRKVYTFTSTADIPLGFKLTSIYQPVRCWGEYTDGTNWYGIIHGTSVAIAGQITFYILPDATPGSKSDLIRFVVGAGAPAITKGLVVIEWISDV